MGSLGLLSCCWPSLVRAAAACAEHQQKLLQECEHYCSKSPCPAPIRGSLARSGTRFTPARPAWQTAQSRHCQPGSNPFVSCSTGPGSWGSMHHGMWVPQHGAAPCSDCGSLPASAPRVPHSASNPMTNPAGIWSIGLCRVPSLWAAARRRGGGGNGGHFGLRHLSGAAGNGQRQQSTKSKMFCKQEGAGGSLLGSTGDCVSPGRWGGTPGRRR